MCNVFSLASLLAQMVKSACSVGDPGSIPGLGRFPGEENGNSLQYSCLKNSVGRGAWWAAIIYGVAQSQTQLKRVSSSSSTGVDCHFLLQRIFPTQGSNPGLPHCRQMLYRLSHQGSCIRVFSNESALRIRWPKH